MKTAFKLGIAILLWMAIFIPRSTPAAGVTLITHGLLSNADGWVKGMAESIPNHPSFAGQPTTYEITVSAIGSMLFTQWSRTAGELPTSTESGEILIRLDWGSLARLNLLGFTTHDTGLVAPFVAAALTSKDFIHELGGHALAEFPIHLIGHSRGGSLVCEVSRLLGVQGIWTDQVTTLDPHPLSFLGMDAPANSYETVLFQDNYYQTIDLLTYGFFIPGAFNRRLVTLAGGYNDNHSNAHLWYHGTIDLRPFHGGSGPAWDGEQSLGSNERLNWYFNQETQGMLTGFYYSLIGRGDRQSTNQPSGAGTSKIRDGFNQVYDFGAGHVGNRTFLTSNTGNWPNVMKLNVTSTNVVSQGQNISAKIYLQWARTAGSTGTLEFYSDDDLNPLNGNSRLIKEFIFESTGPDNIGIYPVDLPIDSTNSPAGYRAVYAKIQAEGKTRYLYAPEILTVVGGPRLDIARAGQQWSVGVDGKAGQTIVIDASTNLSTWTPVITNQLTSDRWVYTPASQGQESFRFFRARTAP